MPTIRLGPCGADCAAPCGSGPTLDLIFVDQFRPLCALTTFWSLIRSSSLPSGPSVGTVTAVRVRRTTGEWVSCTYAASLAWITGIIGGTYEVGPGWYVNRTAIDRVEVTYSVAGIITYQASPPDPGDPTYIITSAQDYWAGPYIPAALPPDPTSDCTRWSRNAGTFATNRQTRLVEPCDTLEHTGTTQPAISAAFTAWSTSTASCALPASWLHDTWSASGAITIPYTGIGSATVDYVIAKTACTETPTVSAQFTANIQNPTVDCGNAIDETLYADGAAYDRSIHGYVVRLRLRARFVRTWNPNTATPCGVACSSAPLIRRSAVQDVRDLLLYLRVEPR